MARVGVADFHKPYLNPNQRCQYWKEVIGRDAWEHAFHPLRRPLPRPGYQDLMSTSKDDQSYVVQLMRHSFIVGRDDHGMSYLDGRQRPVGMPKVDTRLATVTMQPIPVGEVPLTNSTLERSLRAKRTSGAVQMAATLSSIRGDTDFGRSDRLPSLRAPAYSNHLPGWGSSSMPSLRQAEFHRMPSFNRILNV
eukprot:s1777_g13.t1